MEGKQTFKLIVLMVIAVLFYFLIQAIQMTYYDIKLKKLIKESEKIEFDTNVTTTNYLLTK